MIDTHLKVFMGVEQVFAGSFFYNVMDHLVNMFFIVNMARLYIIFSFMKICKLLILPSKIL